MNKLCVLLLVSLLSALGAGCGDDDSSDDDTGEHGHDSGAHDKDDGGESEADGG